jgi:hypothetical protein
MAKRKKSINRIHELLDGLDYIQWMIAKVTEDPDWIKVFIIDAYLDECKEVTRNSDDNKLSPTAILRTIKDIIEDDGEEWKALNNALDEIRLDAMLGDMRDEL